MARHYLRSQLAPAEVLDNIRARGRERRESQLADTVQRRGGFGIRVRVEPPRFSLVLASTLKRAWSDPELLGWVRPIPGGGSEIVYRARLFWIFPAFPAAVATLGFIGLVLPAVKAGLVLTAILRTTAVLFGSAGVWWLVDRLSPSRSSELGELENVVRRAAELELNQASSSTGSSSA